jgi:hypothetical protein
LLPVMFLVLSCRVAGGQMVAFRGAPQAAAMSAFHPVSQSQ